MRAAELPPPPPDGNDVATLIHRLVRPTANDIAIILAAVAAVAKESPDFSEEEQAMLVESIDGSYDLARDLAPLPVSEPGDWPVYRRAA